MKIRRIEETDGVWVEVQLTDWPRDDESQEQFEERMVRLTGRLMTLNTAEEKMAEVDPLPECECHLTGYDPNLCPRHRLKPDLNGPAKEPTDDPD